MFWIIKTRTAWGRLDRRLFVRELTLVQNYNENLLLRESKASYNCEDPGTISPRCSRAKTFAILKSVGFSCKAFITSII